MTNAISQERRVELRAYTFLTLAFVIMALNVVVARAAHLDIPANGLSFWRWLLAAVVFLPFSWRKIIEQRALILKHWKALAALSLVMIPLGNNLVYVGLQETSALNGGLIPVARPAIILVIVALILGGPVSRYQWIGVGIAALGVVTVITNGDPSVLLDLTFNPGDLWLVAASCGIATYQATVGRLPKTIHPNVLLQVVIVLGTLMMLPIYLWETATIRPVEPTWPAIGAIVFTGTLPAVVAVWLINAGIAAVGPARMGIFNLLQPIFVALISVPVLGEVVGWHHPAALALVAIGIAISSRRR